MARALENQIKRYPVGDDDGRIAYEPGIPEDRGMVETVTHVNGKAAPNPAPPPVAPKRPAAVPAVTDAAAGCDRLGELLDDIPDLLRVGNVAAAVGGIARLRELTNRLERLLGGERSGGPK